MTSAPKSAVAIETPGPPVPDREPNLVSFGLRHLFIFFSLATAFCAAMANLDRVWALVVGSLIALLAAHVFGTFLGTRLRDTSSDVQRWKARPGSADRDEPVALPQPVSVADLRLPATTTLASFEKVGRWRHWFVGAGMVLGVLLGGAAIATAGGHGVTWPGIGLGAISCGVIGAWAALLGTNFYVIARHTLRQAARDPARENSTQRHA